VAFAVLLGVGYGGFVALGPEVALGYFGVVGLGGVMGLVFLAFGLGGLVGPPPGGLLADVTDGSAIPITPVTVSPSATNAIDLPWVASVSASCRNELMDSPCPSIHAALPTRTLTPSTTPLTPCPGSASIAWT
jgi:MFS family permease